MQPNRHIYEVRPRKDRRGIDLISEALPFGRLWYGRAEDAIGYAKFYSRSHDAVIRVYDETSNVIETHEHAGLNLPSTYTKGNEAFARGWNHCPPEESSDFRPKP